MRSFVRISLIGLVALVAIGFAVNQQQTSGTGDKEQATVLPGVCEKDGISFVVDFGTSQTQAMIAKCIQNFTGYSWDLFEQANIEVTGTEKYPVGFVCRIENFPNDNQEKCQDTPGNKTGSWAYFLTDENGDWKYSPIGASTHKAKCGVSEGWRFLLPGEPTQSPPRVSLKAYVCNL